MLQIVRMMHKPRLGLVHISKLSFTVKGGESTYGNMKRSGENESVIDSVKQETRAGAADEEGKGHVEDLKPMDEL